MNYEELFEAWRRERKNRQLQPLPKDFYKNLAQYIKTLREKASRAEGIERRLAERELENAENLAKSLMKTRFLKIMRRVIMKKPIPKENLAPEEVELKEQIQRVQEAFRSLLRQALALSEAGGKVKLEGLLEEEAKKPKRILVRLLRDVPAIVGADMRPYGPFKREDIAVLPAENALALVGRGVAVEVKVDEDAEGD